MVAISLTRIVNFATSSSAELTSRGDDTQPPAVFGKDETRSSGPPVSPPARQSSSKAGSRSTSRSTTLNKLASMTLKVKTYSASFAEHYKKIAEDAAERDRLGRAAADYDALSKKPLLSGVSFKARKIHDLHVMSKAARVFDS